MGTCIFLCSSVSQGELRIRYSHTYESAAFDKRIEPATEYSQAESVWAAKKDCYDLFSQSNEYQVTRNKLSRFHETFHYQTNKSATHSNLEAAMSPGYFGFAHEYRIS